MVGSHQYTVVFLRNCRRSLQIWSDSLRRLGLLLPGPLHHFLIQERKLCLPDCGRSNSLSMMLFLQGFKLALQVHRRPFPPEHHADYRLQPHAVFRERLGRVGPCAPRREYRLGVQDPARPIRLGSNAVCLCQRHAGLCRGGCHLGLGKTSGPPEQAHDRASSSYSCRSALASASPFPSSTARYGGPWSPCLSGHCCRLPPRLHLLDFRRLLGFPNRV